MTYVKILNPNVRSALLKEVVEPYILTEAGSQKVFDYNQNLPDSYFEHLEFPVSDFWYEYFSSKLDSAEMKSKEKALDVCAGTGTLILNVMAKKYFKNCTAIDISEAAIKRLNERIVELGIEGCKAKCDNIMNTAFNNDEFDCIMGNSFLHHLPDNKKFFKEMHRILKPGGSICFTGEPTVSCSALEGLFLGNFIKLLRFLRIKPKVTNPSLSDIWSYDRHSLEILLEEAGFNEIKIIPFGFLVAILNEPTSFILSKLTGKSMQSEGYWNFFGRIDRNLFSWVAANTHSHFTITAKK